MWAVSPPPDLTGAKLTLCTPSTWEAIGWEAELSWDSFEVRCGKRLLYLQPFWEMPRCPAIYCIWHHDDCQVSQCRFLIYFSQHLSAGSNSYLDIGRSQLQPDQVCMGQDSFRILFAYVMHHFTSTALEFKHVHRPKLIRLQTFSVSLPKNKTNLLSSPKGPVLLIWCSSCTDPNIMHFPSPENLHTAQ